MEEHPISVDDASAVVQHHQLYVAEHSRPKYLAPFQHFGHGLEELMDLARTKHHGGDSVVSPESLVASVQPTKNAIRVRVHSAEGNLKQLILDHNCRTNVGGTWLNILMGGDTNANIGYENHSGAVAYTGTTVTPTASPTWTTNQWAGHEVYSLTTIGATPTVVKGHVISNSATALTIDQWYSITSTSGAAGSTPAANASFAISQGQAPAYWIAFSSDVTTEDIGDSTFASEFTNGFTVAGRWKGAYTQTTPPSGTGTTNSNSIYKLDTGVLTANLTKTTAKLYLTHFQNGGTPDFSKKLTTAASTITSDTLDASWAITDA